MKKVYLVVTVLLVISKLLIGQMLPDATNLKKPTEIQSGYILVNHLLPDESLNFINTLTNSEALTKYFLYGPSEVPATITTAPTSKITCDGLSVTFTVVGAGTPVLGYIWYKGAAIPANIISGATTSVFTINPATSSNAGDYKVRVFNAFGYETSGYFHLTVNSAITLSELPENVHICPGDSNIYTITVSPAGTYSYQWYMNNDPISGATSTAYTAKSAASYYCIVDAGCLDISNTSVLTIDAIPSITDQSNESVKTCLAEPVTLFVTAIGTSLTYQWYKDEIIIEGSTADTLNTATSGEYFCIVSGKCPPSVTSKTIKVSDSLPTIITNLPANQKQCSSDIDNNYDVTFIIEATGVSLSYQWYEGDIDNPLPGSDESSLTISHVTIDDAGVYFVVVSDVCGSVRSSNDTLQIDLPVVNDVIVTHTPEGIHHCSGAEITFTASTTEGTNLNYQWYYYDGAVGNNSSTFTIDSVTTENAGEYTCVVTNTCGSFRSNNDSIIVDTPIIITQDLPSITKSCNSDEVNSYNVTFTVEATGTDPSYQWYEGNIENPLPFANNNFLTISNVTTDDAGVYFVVVSNSCGEVKSKNDTLQIELPVTNEIIVSHTPEGLNQCTGTEITFTATATEGTNLSYQWYYNTDPIGNNSSTFTLDSATTANSGNYSCVITNLCGSYTSNTDALFIDRKGDFSLNHDPLDKVCTGAAIEYLVYTFGAIPLSYQWTKDGIDIDGDTTSVFKIDTIKTSDAGEYTCKVSNSCGLFTNDVRRSNTESIILTVEEPITKSIGDINPGTEVCSGDTVNVFVKTDGSNVVYQWRLDDNVINDATDTSYTFVASPESSGIYTVDVSNFCGSLNGQFDLTLKVDTALSITEDLLSLTSVCNSDENNSYDATFTIGVVGESPSYQWYEGNLENPLPFANNNFLTISHVTTDDAGVYFVVVTNVCGSLTSNFDTLIVDMPIVSGANITVSPDSTNLCSGISATLTANTTDGTNINYQWYYNDSPVGENISTYTVNETSGDNNGDYYCVLSNSCGKITSDTLTLTFYPPSELILSYSTEGDSLCEGNSTNLVVNGIPFLPYTIQWYLNGEIIEGATTDPYLLDPVETGNTGQYYMVITTVCESVTSDPISLTVFAPPVITVQSQDTLITCSDTPITLFVTTTGTNLTYQWYNNEGVIEGSTSDTLSTATAGTYYSIVSGTCGSPVTSDSIVLNLNTPALIVSQPSGGIQCEDFEYTFTIVAEGAEPLTYQWYKDGNPLEFIGTSFTLESVVASDAGNYTCVVTNVCGNVTSDAAFLDIQVLPDIDEQPIGGAKCFGDNVILSVTASGSTGLMYQWYKNQRSIHNATNSTYTINNIGLTGAGSYFCIVSNECALIQSDVAVITVGSSVAITEQPVGFEECVGTEVQFSLTATGTSPSYQWYKNGILIPLATNRTYGIQSIALFDAGNYKCIVSGCNTIESDVVSLTVNTPPEITAQTEQDAHTCPGISKELFVTATGKDLSYQWYNTSGIMIDENLSTLNTDIADSYYCIVSGTCAPNTTTSLEITLSIDSAPSIEITATSHVKYAEDSIVYTVEPSGTAPFYYQWKKDNIDLPGATNSTLELNPILFGDAGIYSVNISNACGNEPTPVIDTLTVINKFTVDGTLTYDNLASTPITNTKLYLIKNVIEEEDVRYPFPPPSGSIDSTITDISGHFVFNHVIAGRYRIIPVITKPWGGSNPTDALIVNRNYIGLYTFIDDLKERAADVSSDTIIEPLDALLINQRYVRKIKTFPGADWLYSGDVFEVTDSMTYDIKAICTGDANGSYVPGLRYEYVDFNKEGNIVVKPGEMFNMPLIIGKDVDLGAIGLKIKYSGVKVYDVISDIKGLVYNIEDNNVYIAWTSTPNNSVNLKAGDQFIYLKCMLINNVTDLDNIFILSSESKLAYNSSESELADNSSESELADNNINEINEQIINMPKLQQVQVSNAEFSFGSYPNPFTSITTITYYLPEACDVTITVNNLLGQEMQTLVSEQKDKGLYNVTFDAGSLAKGVYSYRISAGSNTGTGKLLLVK